MELISENFISEKQKIVSGLDKIPLKTNCMGRSFLIGVRQTILNSCELDKPPDYKIERNSKFQYPGKVFKSIVSEITFHLEDGENNMLNFKGETLTFALQLTKI